MSAMLLLFDDGGFNPRSLFTAGEQGAWYDPSDFSTLFQDSAGTTPVTALGQPVGKILDKSGRGNHATQSTAASRPTLQQDSNGMYYLSFDGVDDWLQTASINFTGTDKMTVWAGVRKNSALNYGCLVELSANSTINNGAFMLFSPYLLENYMFASKGSLLSPAISGAYAAPVSNVITGLGSISSDSSILRVNGSQVGSGTADQGTGNYGNYPLYIGRRGGVGYPFNGRIYQLIVRGAASNAGQIAAGEAYVNSKTRAY